MRSIKKRKRNKERTRGSGSCHNVQLQESVRIRTNVEGASELGPLLPATHFFRIKGWSAGGWRFAFFLSGGAPSSNSDTHPHPDTMLESPAFLRRNCVSTSLARARMICAHDWQCPVFPSAVLCRVDLRRLRLLFVECDASQLPVFRCCFSGLFPAPSHFHC